MKIRKDKWGLFVVVNGGVYRPQWSRDTGPGSPGGRQSSHKEGDVVKGRNIQQSPHAQVGEEIWSHHGPSPECQKVLGKSVGSELSWNPHPEEEMVK